MKLTITGPHFLHFQLGFEFSILNLSNLCMLLGVHFLHSYVDFLIDIESL
jgi:hypothetical protein